MGTTTIDARAETLRLINVARWSFGERKLHDLIVGVPGDGNCCPIKRTIKAIDSTIVVHGQTMEGDTQIMLRLARLWHVEPVKKSKWEGSKLPHGRTAIDLPQAMQAFIADFDTFEDHRDLIEADFLAAAMSGVIALVRLLVTHPPLIDPIVEATVELVVQASENCAPDTVPAAWSQELQPA